MTVAVGLRLGVNTCVSHSSPCRTRANAQDAYGLSSRLVSGRAARHHLLNDRVWRALPKADVQSIKEPVGIKSSASQRPDGLIFIPWLQGKPLILDATVVDTAADSYLSRSAISQVELLSAELAVDNKCAKYITLPQHTPVSACGLQDLWPNQRLSD